MSDIPTSDRRPEGQASTNTASSAPYLLRRRWRIPLVLAGAVLIACLGLGYRYQGQLLTIVHFTNELTGSTTLSVVALGLSVFFVLCLLAWLLLPFFVVAAYLDLRRRLPSEGSRPRSGGPPGPS